MRVTQHGNRELRAEIVDETWVRLRTGEDAVLTLSLVEAAELVALLRVQIGLLAFRMGRAHASGADSGTSR